MQPQPRETMCGQFEMEFHFLKHQTDRSRGPRPVEVKKILIEFILWLFPHVSRKGLKIIVVTNRHFGCVWKYHAVLKLTLKMISQVNTKIYNTEWWPALCEASRHLERSPTFCERIFVSLSVIPILEDPAEAKVFMNILIVQF